MIVQIRARNTSYRQDWCFAFRVLATIMNRIKRYIIRGNYKRRRPTLDYHVGCRHEMRRDTFGRWLVVVRMQRDCMQGIIVIDKPPGVSSRMSWAALNGGCRGVKVGHAGTLDPFATRLLALVGKATSLVKN